jgi:hypothetical protein
MDVSLYAGLGRFLPIIVYFVLSKAVNMFIVIFFDEMWCELFVTFRAQHFIGDTSQLGRLKMDRKVFKRKCLVIDQIIEAIVDLPRQEVLHGQVTIQIATPFSY